MAFAIAAEIARALRVEVGVERDLVDAEAAEQLRQHDRGVAPRVVDDDLEARFLDGVGRERFEKRAAVPLEHPRGKVEQADVVHRRAPEVFAKEDVLDLALGVLVGRDPARVEEFHHHGVGIVGRDAHVDAAVAAHPHRVARERQRIRAQVEHVDPDAQQPRDHAAVHHARGRMRVAARHHRLTRFQVRAERLAELEREFGGDLEVRETGDADRAEQRARPLLAVDQRHRDDRTGRHPLVGPQLEVRVDDRPRADRAAAADDRRFADVALRSIVLRSAIVQSSITASSPM